MKKHIKLANEIRECLTYKGMTSGDAVAIHEILDKHAPIEKPFPKLMKSKDFGDVVFFASSENGILIKSKNGSYSVGENGDCWNIDYFEDCEIGVIS